MSRRLILTGAAGSIGRMLSERLATAGHKLLLTDIVDQPGPIPPNTEFRRIDLQDKEAILGLAAETLAILHFGAVTTEHFFEDVLGPNILGTYHIFELARRAGARVVLASSNHVIGFYERSTMLDENCHVRPDGFYGLSKATGELMGRLYWDKHGIESLAIRIGSCVRRPKNVRHLSTWISHNDLVGLIEAALTTQSLGCRVAWGVSANTRCWWRNHGLKALGYTPRDDAEEFAATFDEPKIAGNPLALRYQGGCFCAIDYTRDHPSPIDIFDWMKEK